MRLCNSLNSVNQGLNETAATAGVVATPTSCDCCCCVLSHWRQLCFCLFPPSSLTCLILPSYHCITWPLSSSSCWFAVVSVSSFPYSCPLSLSSCLSFFACINSELSCLRGASLSHSVWLNALVYTHVPVPWASCPAVEMLACFLIRAAITNCAIGRYSYIRREPELIGLTCSFE